MTDRQTVAERQAGRTVKTADGKRIPLEQITQKGGKR